MFIPMCHEHERTSDISTFTDTANNLRRWLCCCGVPWVETVLPVPTIAEPQPAAPDPQPPEQPKIRFREFL